MFNVIFCIAYSVVKCLNVRTTVDLEKNEHIIVCVGGGGVCVCACVRACVHACVRACAYVGVFFKFDKCHTSNRCDRHVIWHLQFKLRDL